MSILQIILSCIGILFIIWIYAFIWYEKTPSLDFSKIQSWWQEHRSNLFISLLNKMLETLLSILKWLFKIIKEIVNFIIELTVEIIFNLIIRGIWALIKSLFLLIFRIFD